MDWREINMKYIPTIGDVVLYGGGTAPKVVVDMINHEDFGSCCYDRKYLSLSLSTFSSLKCGFFLFSIWLIIYKQA